jgi:hypothetical protein
MVGGGIVGVEVGPTVLVGTGAGVALQAGRSNKMHKPKNIKIE